MPTTGPLRVDVADDVGCVACGLRAVDAREAGASPRSGGLRTPAASDSPSESMATVAARRFAGAMAVAGVERSV